MSEENKAAIEKVPVWVWVITALGICACCTYTDPDKEDDAVVNDNLRELNLQREQEFQNLADLSDHENDEEAKAHDSEAFLLEYFRKLYRQ